MSALAAGGARRPSVLVILLALVVLYLVHAHLYRPSVRESAAIRFRAEEIGAWTERANASVPASAARSGPTLEAYRSRMLQLESLVPAREDLAALLDAISRVERRAGVEVTMLRPEDPRPADAGAPYEGRGYRVTAAGGYHPIASFLTAIASLERIMAPADLVLSADPATALDPTQSFAPDPGAARLVADFRILTLVLPKETQP